MNLQSRVFSLIPLFPNMAREVEPAVKKSMARFDKLFGGKLPFIPRPVFLYSREEIDRVIGRKTEPWVIGFASDNEIYLLHPSKYATESSHVNDGNNTFFKVLEHELFHLYYAQYAGEYYPRWLVEGSACYFADQRKWKQPKEVMLKIFGSQPVVTNLYQIGYNWVKLLADKFGEEKIILLIKAINGEKYTREKFSEIFFSVYGLEFSEEGLGKLL